MSGRRSTISARRVIALGSLSLGPLYYLFKTRSGVRHFRRLNQSITCLSRAGGDRGLCSTNCDPANLDAVSFSFLHHAMRIEELIIDGTHSEDEGNIFNRAFRLQVIPCPDPNLRMGLVFQRHYWSERLGQVQHPGRDLLRSRPHKYVHGAYPMQRREKPSLTRPRCVLPTNKTSSTNEVKLA